MHRHKSDTGKCVCVWARVSLEKGAVLSWAPRKTQRRQTCKQHGTGNPVLHLLVVYPSTVNQRWQEDPEDKWVLFSPTCFPLTAGAPMPDFSSLPFSYSDSLFDWCLGRGSMKGWLMALTLLFVPPAPRHVAVAGEHRTVILQPGSEPQRSQPAVVPRWRGGCSTWLASLWVDLLTSNLLPPPVSRNSLRRLKCIQSSLFSHFNFHNVFCFHFLYIALFAFPSGAWNILITFFFS